MAELIGKNTLDQFWIRVSFCTDEEIEVLKELGTIYSFNKKFTVAEAGGAMTCFVVSDLWEKTKGLGTTLLQIEANQYVRGAVRCALLGGDGMWDATRKVAEMEEDFKSFDSMDDIDSSTHPEKYALSEAINLFHEGILRKYKCHYKITCTSAEIVYPLIAKEIKNRNLDIEQQNPNWMEFDSHLNKEEMEAFLGIYLLSIDSYEIKREEQS